MNFYALQAHLVRTSPASAKAARDWLAHLRHEAAHKSESDGQRMAIGRFRRLNPFIAEECILECFRECLFTVLERPRYTGDGGIDGIITLDGHCHYYLQVKRYKGHINVRHFEAFARLVEQHQKKTPRLYGGFFIHSGTTGSLVRTISQLYPHIILMSGSNLATFLLHPQSGLDATLARIEKTH